jgi:hypothetical protein
VTLTILTTACGAVGSSKVLCPQLVEYSKEFQLKASEELRALGKTDSQIKTLLDDYRKLRAACRSLEDD